MIPQNQIQEILKDENGALFDGHEKVLLALYGQGHCRVSSKLWNCQKTKISRNSPNLLTPSLVCSKTHQRVHLDMIAAPVASGNNNRYILSFTNAFSKYAELVAISDRTPETVAKAIFTRWICRYGVPTEIITNREKQFCNKVTVQLYKAMKLNPDTGCQFPTFYFQEKMANRTIDKYLKQIFELMTTDWEIYLAPLMYSYKTSFNRTFQTSPHIVILGQHAR